MVPLQHHVWHRLPGAAAVLQQPHPAARGPRVRGAEPRGEVGTSPRCLRSPAARFPSSRCSRFPCGFSFWIQLSLSVASFSVEPNGPPLLFHPLISTKAWGGQHLWWGRRGACRVRSAQRLLRDVRSRDSGHLYTVSPLGKDCSC